MMTAGTTGLQYAGSSGLGGGGGGGGDYGSMPEDTESSTIDDQPCQCPWIINNTGVEDKALIIANEKLAQAYQTWLRQVAASGQETKLRALYEGLDGQKLSNTLKDQSTTQTSVVLKNGHAVTCPKHKPPTPERESNPRPLFDEFSNVMSLLGYSVGIATTWRFPYLMLKHNGLPFLVIYTFLHFTFGTLLAFLEISLYRLKLDLGPAELFRRICPLLDGIGICMLIGAGCLLSYYSVITAWCFQYITWSFSSALPWHVCKIPAPSVQEGAPKVGGCRSAEIFLEKLTVLTVRDLLDSVKVNIAGLNASARYSLDSWVSCNFTKSVNIYISDAIQRLPSQVINGTRTKLKFGVEDIESWYGPKAEGPMLDPEEGQSLKLLSTQSFFTARNTICRKSIQGQVLQPNDDGGYDIEMSTCFAIFLSLSLTAALVHFQGNKLVNRVIAFGSAALIVGLIRSATIDSVPLKQAMDMEQPTLNNLTSLDLWYDCLTQVLISFGITTGCLRSAIIDKKHMKSLHYAVVLAACIYVMAIAGSMLTYCCLAYMAFEGSQPFSLVLFERERIGCLTVSHSALITVFPFSAMWAHAFFLMLALISVASQFRLLAVIRDAVSRAIQGTKWAEKKWFLTVGLLPIQVVPCVLLSSQIGNVTIPFIDQYVVGILMILLAMIECLLITRLYGYQRFWMELRKVSIANYCVPPNFEDIITRNQYALSLLKPPLKPDKPPLPDKSDFHKYDSIKRSPLNSQTSLDLLASRPKVTLDIRNGSKIILDSTPSYDSTSDNDERAFCTNWDRRKKPVRFKNDYYLNEQLEKCGIQRTFQNGEIHGYGDLNLPTVSATGLFENNAHIRGINRDIDRNINRDIDRNIDQGLDRSYESPRRRNEKDPLIWEKTMQKNSVPRLNPEQTLAPALPYKPIPICTALVGLITDKKLSKKNRFRVLFIWLLKHFLNLMFSVVLPLCCLGIVVGRCFIESQNRHETTRVRQSFKLTADGLRQAVETNDYEPFPGAIDKLARQYHHSKVWNEKSTSDMELAMIPDALKNTFVYKEDEHKLTARDYGTVIRFIMIHCEKCRGFLFKTIIGWSGKSSEKYPVWLDAVGFGGTLGVLLIIPILAFYRILVDDKKTNLREKIRLLTTPADDNKDAGNAAIPNNPQSRNHEGQPAIETCL